MSGIILYMEFGFLSLTSSEPFLDGISFTQHA